MRQPLLGQVRKAQLEQLHNQRMPAMPAMPTPRAAPPGPMPGMFPPAPPYGQPQFYPPPAMPPRGPAGPAMGGMYGAPMVPRGMPQVCCWLAASLSTPQGSSKSSCYIMGTSMLP